ncbi:radiation sensitive protein rad9 [Emydomyces testavorans]|uniref:Radiation sensitive protein rad9 n=1 Tax=Emydomyces testavorans TaxID=2070801 RepID=A0AAF0DCY9_9EURO|nr:radiation sensitive protein rad9 [Emydomyces testavorans]
MAPAVETQDDSLDLTYLKQAVLGIGNGSTADTNAEVPGSLSDEVHQHGQFHINVIVAAEMASKQHGLDTDAPPQFSYQQNPCTNVTKQLSSHTDAWNTAPNSPAKVMTPTDSPPGDTQLVSQSVYDDLLKQGNIEGERSNPHPSDGLENNDAGVTQKTLWEGDTGHLDLLVDLDETSHAVKLSEEGAMSGAEDGVSSPAHYQPFPESQRFVERTPCGQGSTGLGTNASITTPSLPRNPFALENKTPSSVMALSQLFNATQATPSPLMNVLRPELSSDMPSPNLPVQSRQTATSLFSPLQTTSSIIRRGFLEPQADYVSMKESQEVRARLDQQHRSLSAPTYPSDNLATDDLLIDEQSLQHRSRQRDVENELRKQFESVSAPLRPESRSFYPKMTDLSTSSRSPNVNSKTISSPAKNEAAGGAVQSDVGPESELETEQEDEDNVSRVSGSQALLVNGDDDKENVDSEAMHSSNPTVFAHDALSQALELQEGLPPSQTNLENNPHLVVCPSQPLNSHNIPILSSGSDGSHCERVLNSQPYVQGDDNTQLRVTSPREEPPLRFQTPDSGIQEPNFNTGLNTVSRPSPPPPTVLSKSPKGDIWTGQQVPTSTEIRATYSPGLKSASPGLVDNLKQHFPNPVDRALDCADQNEVQNGTVCQKDGNACGDTPMLSFVFETPARRPVDAGGLPGTIPETSPDDQRVPSPRVLHDCPKSEDPNTLPESDVDLPAMSYISSQNCRRVGATFWPRKDTSNRFCSILSSPSGRQRRSMTEIASDQSPKQTGPEIPLEDIDLLTTEDKAFQAMVLDSENPVTKRRKVNGGRGSLGSSRFGRPQLQNQNIGQDKALKPSTKPNSEPIDGNTVLVSGNADSFRTQTKRNTVSKNIWEVDDSPRRDVQNHRSLRRTRKARGLSITQDAQNGGKRYSVAEAVVIYSKSSSSPAPTERITSDPPTHEESPALDKAEPTGEFSPERFDFSNQVFAFYNGQPHGYYPATCVGMSNDVGRQRYMVLFEDSETPEELDIASVKKLELRINDTVKVFSLDMPKIPYLVMGLTDKLDASTIAQYNTGSSPKLTDTHGHASVILTPKQEGILVNGQRVITVPISRIYLDKNLWSRLGIRQYSYVASMSNSISRLQTPVDCGITSFTPAFTRTPRKENLTAGIFSGMAIAISYTHNEKELSRLEQLIFRNGGRILKEGFDELFELPFSPSSAERNAPSLRLTSRAEQLGFVCLITDNYSRRLKYMQALALNLPCLAGRWVDHCVAKGAIIEWEPYLLAAGESIVLQKAVKSRILPPYLAATAQLTHTINERHKPLAGQSVILVMNRGNAVDHRKPYAFLIYALGPDRVDHVQDVQAVVDILNQSHENRAQDSFSSCIWVYVGDDEAVKAARKILMPFSKNSTPKAGSVRGRGRPPKKRKKSSDTEDTSVTDDVDEYQVNGRKVRLLDNEHICQILIFGNLFDGWPAIQLEGHQA